MGHNGKAKVIRRPSLGPTLIASLQHKTTRLAPEKTDGNTRIHTHKHSLHAERLAHLRLV